MVFRFIFTAIILALPATTCFGDGVIFGADKGWQGWSTSGDEISLAPRSRLGHPSRQSPAWESGETSKSWAKSPIFKIDCDVLKFWVNGWDGRAGGMGLNGFALRSAKDGSVIRKATSPQQDEYMPKTWVVSDLRGKDVYFEIYDNFSQPGFAWVGLAQIEGVNMEVPADKSPYRAVPLGGGLGIWSVYGTDGAQRKVEPYLSSLATGESAVGSVRSPEFTVSTPVIKLKLRGHDGHPDIMGNNLASLVDAATGEVLRKASPPQSDQSKWTEWDVTDIQGRTVYLILIDGDRNNGFAWFGLDAVDAGPVFSVDFAKSASPDGWTVSGSDDMQAEIAGIPFQVALSSPVSPDGVFRVDIGFKAKHIFLIGMTNSMDWGNPCWSNPEDYKPRFFVGDRLGDIDVKYDDGSVDTYPLILGESMWWGKRFFEHQEPFASDPKAAKVLAETLRLYPSAPVADGRYLAAITPRPKKIEAIEIIDCPAKSGAPVVSGITVELEPGESAPDLAALPHSSIKPEVLEFAVSMPLQPQGVDETGREAALERLRNTFYTTEANFPRSVPVDIPQGYRGPNVRFKGDGYAEVLTNIFYHNVHDMDMKVTADGMYHTSTKGAPSWGGYEGFGTYNKDWSSYYAHSWTRDMGRAIGELAALGYLDKARINADYVFDMARIWEEGPPDGFKPVLGSMRLDLNGAKLPRHICRILQNPDTTPGQGNFENDGHGMTALAFYNLWRRIPDRDEWLRKRRQDIFGLGDWVIWQLENPALSGATETLCTDSECSGGIGHSVYADMAQIEALRALAEMADSIGETAKADQWRKAADRLYAGCETEYIVNDENYGPTWTLKSSGWPNQATVLGPVIFLADRRGFDPKVDDPKWRKWTETAYKRLVEKYKPFGFYGVAMGYGQGFVTQAALLFDKMRDASAMLQWAAKCTWNPNHRQYIVPEGCEVHPSGKYWHRTGDLGNGVQEAEIVKAIRLVIGVDNTCNDMLRIYPRMPHGWTEISIENYPVWINQGGKVEQSMIGYTLKREGSSMKMEMPDLQRLGKVGLRFGPFKTAADAREVYLNGRKLPVTVERSGDSWWGSANTR